MELLRYPGLALKTQNLNHLTVDDIPSQCHLISLLRNLGREEYFSHHRDISMRGQWDLHKNSFVLVAISSGTPINTCLP